MAKLYIASDHGGFKLKEKIKDYLNKQGVEYEDLGTHGGDLEDDYPDYALKVGKKVSKGKGNQGILICGSGSGMAMAVNKVKGIRASMAYDTYSAKMARVDNDANVLCLRERYFAPANAKKIVAIWLNTEFSGLARHKRRIGKISKYERKG
jgi:ribose 5-phosphate isomerase B